MKNKILLIFVFSFIVNTAVFSQVNIALTIQDTTSNGQTYRVLTDNSGNIYACGEVGTLFTVSKYDAAGNLIWKDQCADEGEASDMELVGNSNIYVTGLKTVNNIRIVIIQKYTSEGIRVWEISPTQDNNLNDSANIEQDNNGNLIINYSVTDTLTSQTTFHTKKYDNDGSILFTYEKTLPGRGISKMKVDGTGNIYILYRESFTVEKLNPSGNLLWSKVFNATEENYAGDLCVDGSSDVFIIGTQNNTSTMNDFATVKYNSSGVLQWSSFYNNTSVTTGNSDIGVSITVDNNGNIISGGNSKTGGIRNRSVGVVVKYNPNGGELWSATTQPLNTIEANSTRGISSDNQRNIYLVLRSQGTTTPTRSRARVYKFNEGGSLLWETIGSSNYYDNPQDLLVSNDSTFYIAGRAGNPLIGFCFTVVKFGQNGIIGILNNSTPLKYSLFQNYPNPFNPSTSIRFDIQRPGLVRLTVFDFLGRKIKTLINRSLQPGSYEETFDAEGLSSGIYFYRLETDGFTDTRKMILLK